MKTRTMIAVILAMLLLASPGKAQNAALQYWPGFQFLPHDEAELKMLKDWRELPLDDKAQKLVEDRQSLHYLHAGAQIKQCDWGIDLSQGPYTLLPYLNKSRPLTYMGCLKVRLDASRKNWPAAVEDGGDVLVAARHVATPALMISLLVSYANQRDAIEAIALSLNSFDRPSLAQLTARLDALPPMPSQSDSLKVESKATVDWAIQKIKAAGPNPNWHEVLGFLEIGDDGKPSEKPLDQLIKAAGDKPQNVVHAFESLSSFYTDAEKLVAAPLSQAEFAKQAQDLASRHANNPFAAPILPALPQAHSAVIAAETRMTLLRAAIAVVQNGPDAVKQFTDPGDHQPITYQPRPGGFELTSKITHQNQPVTLVVGGTK